MEKLQVIYVLIGSLESSHTLKSKLCEYAEDIKEEEYDYMYHQYIRKTYCEQVYYLHIASDHIRLRVTSDQGELFDQLQKQIEQVLGEQVNSKNYEKRLEVAGQVQKTLEPCNGYNPRMTYRLKGGVLSLRRKLCQKKSRDIT